MELGNLDFNIGSVNPSGVGETVYRIRKRLISTWPTIVDEPDKAEPDAVATDLSKYKGDFALASGAFWDKIYSTQGKAQLTFEATGETDCKMYTNHLIASFPDMTAEALAFSKTAANDDYVYVAKSARRWHVIGSPDYRSVTQPAGDSGTTAGSAKGITFTVDCPDVTPLPLYEGKIVLKDGTIDLSTGEFTAKSGE
jgi:hypothetical protein